MVKILRRNKRAKNRKSRKLRLLTATWRWWKLDVQWSRANVGSLTETTFAKWRSRCSRSRALTFSWDFCTLVCSPTSLKYFRSKRLCRNYRKSQTRILSNWKNLLLTLWKSVSATVVHLSSKKYAPSSIWRSCRNLTNRPQKSPRTTLKTKTKEMTKTKTASTHKTSSNSQFKTRTRLNSQLRSKNSHLTTRVRNVASLMLKMSADWFASSSRSRNCSKIFTFWKEMKCSVPKEQTRVPTARSLFTNTVPKSSLLSKTRFSTHRKIKLAPRTTDLSLEALLIASRRSLNLRLSKIGLMRLSRSYSNSFWVSTNKYLSAMNISASQQT